MIRKGDEWQAVDWETALESAVRGLQSVTASKPDQLGVLASPNSTIEELHLLARLARAVGSANIDHRLRQQDFRDQDSDPVYLGSGLPFVEVDALQSIFVIGSNLRREVPILAHRVRKAATRNSAQVSFLNTAHHEYLFPVAAYHTVPGGQLVSHLASIVGATAEKAGKSLPAGVQQRVSQATVGDSHRAIAEQLLAGERRAIFVGAMAMRHPAYADLRQLAAALAEITGAKMCFLTEGANAAGAALAGVLPHREAAGKRSAKQGANARQMFDNPLEAYILHGGIEPGRDIGTPRALEALRHARFVVALTPFADEATRSSAHVMLPIGTFAETSGTYVNFEGRWQSFIGAATPVGEARPGWKVLRVLGNLLGLQGFDYESSEEVRDELRAQAGELSYDGKFATQRQLNGDKPHGTSIDVSMYDVDSLVRRAPALQRTREAQAAAQSEPSA